MTFPKVVILAIGGPHGDFLYSCCRIMRGSDAVDVNEKGKTVTVSPLMLQNLKSFKNGEKQDIRYLTDAEVAMCHIWQDEFTSWPSNFFYISYQKHQIKFVKEMYLQKVHNNNLDLAMEDFKGYLPHDLAKKINSKNFDEIMTKAYASSLIKFQSHPKISEIKINDLYIFKSLIEVLKQMDFYDPKYYEKLKDFYTIWTDKNIHYINLMLK